MEPADAAKEGATATRSMRNLQPPMQDRWRVRTKGYCKTIVANQAKLTISCVLNKLSVCL